MTGMDLDAVEAGRLGRFRPVGEGGDGFQDGDIVHDAAALHARRLAARGAFEGRGRGPALAGPGGGPAVPELGYDGAAGSMHGAGDGRPMVEGGAVQLQGIGVVAGRRAVGVGALGEDQARAAFDAAPVEVGQGRGIAVRRRPAGHGGHGDAVGQVQTLAGERLEQRLHRHGSAPGVEEVAADVLAFGGGDLDDAFV
ncbi:MAG: hypothetical protein K0R83_3072, partial [Caulobacter sp.]|nr:hypothetical protein [Caulobacter sp.]